MIPRFLQKSIEAWFETSGMTSFEALREFEEIFQSIEGNRNQDSARNRMRPGSGIGLSTNARLDIYKAGHDPDKVAIAMKAKDYGEYKELMGKK